MWLIYRDDDRYVVRTEETQDIAEEMVKIIPEFGGAIQTNDKDIIKNWRHYIASDDGNELILSDERVEFYRVGTINKKLQGLKKLRNKLLAQCDWVSLPDVQREDKNEWLEYRQALRDWPTLFDPDMELMSYVPIIPGKTREYMMEEFDIHA